MSSNGLSMTDQEIATEYRLAADKEKQIGVLAELNGLPSDRAGRARIREALGRAGIEVPADRKRLTEEEKAGLQVFYEQGMNDHQIAREMGTSSLAVLNWRKKNGLPPNVEAKGGRRKAEESAPRPEVQEVQAVQAAESEPEEFPALSAIPAAELEDTPEPKLKKDRVIYILEDLLFLLPPRPSMRVRNAVEQLANALMADWLEGEWAKNAPADEG